MKHNTCLIRSLFVFIVLIGGFSAHAKIINSEFLNQASFGSEGPQLVEMELAGSRTYVLSYNIPGKSPLFRNISSKEYRNLQEQMRKFLNSAKEENTQTCDHEITYTRVENESKVSNSSLCWSRLTAKRRVQISDWLIGVRKTLQ